MRPRRQGIDRCRWGEQLWGRRGGRVCWPGSWRGGRRRGGSRSGGDMLGRLVEGENQDLSERGREAIYRLFEAVQHT